MLTASVSSHAFATECPEVNSEGARRQIVAISDLHFGVGKTAAGSWHPTEDFLWSSALDGVLRRISQCGKDAVDLVIAGDAFELWQPPEGLECKGGPTNDAGCTPAELRAILKKVIAAHKTDLEAIGTFADTGSNRVYFVPGNHDSALVLDDCWQLVEEAVAARQGRVFRVANGIFIAAEGRVVVEHGHQIGEDVNGYPKWPLITREVNGVIYVERPWGEFFV